VWLTYLRGTIESFNAEGKSWVVGRRPGMASRELQAVADPDLILMFEECGALFVGV
jgi:hypothetical protein